jgi:putative tricarboxylic transport membrane protein
MATPMKTQTILGAGTLVLGLLLAAGATQISSDAGYAGVGPNFLPWLVSVMLTVCGAWLVWESRSGGFREMEEPSGAATGHWPGFVWVSAGLLLNAALLTTLGFILSCTLCFVLAVRGFKSAEDRLDMSPRAWIVDALVGFAIAAPVYWMFSKLLAINLPGITSTGWL